VLYTFLDSQGDGFAGEIGMTFSLRDFLHKLCDHYSWDFRSLLNGHCGIKSEQKVKSCDTLNQWILQKFSVNSFKLKIEEYTLPRSSGFLFLTFCEFHLGI